MSKFTLIVFISLVTTRMLNGAPFSTTNQTTTNVIETPNTKTYDASVCPDNCTFVFSHDSVITAQKTLEKFLHKRKSMLIYVTLYQKNLTLLPADQEKQNQIREWQWTLTENLWYVDLPIDLDYASFHITYYGESRIRLDIEAVDSNCCTIGDDAVNKVRDRLWFDVFSNKSGSLLCNRYFDNQDWKTSFFAVTTVWIGYDLLCVAPDVDKNYSEKFDTTATLLIPLFCFFIALYSPLLNRIIENPNIRNHLERVKSETGMKLTDYKKGDSPFGFRRIILKYFFQTNLLSKATYMGEENVAKKEKVDEKEKVEENEKVEEKVKLVDKLKFVSLFRLTILYFLVYLFMTTVPMFMEYIFDTEELTDFDTIYKLGLPVFHFGEKIHFTFKAQMLITCFLILPLIVIAKFYATYQFSEKSDFLIFISLFDENKYKVDDPHKDENKYKEDDPNKDETKYKVDEIMKKINNREEDIVNEECKTVLETFIIAVLKFEFYSKFIKRFNLLFSTKFWEYIWERSGSKKVVMTHSWKIWCRNLVQITIFSINVLLIVPMCAFPAIWFMLFPIVWRIKSWITPEERKSGGNKQTKLTAYTVNTKMGLITWEIVCIFMLYLDMSMIIFIERSVMYIVFIAITNYEHLLRIVLVISICAGYLGKFIITFVGKYAAVLDIMFTESTKTQPTCNDNIEVPDGLKAFHNETKTVKSKDVSDATKDSTSHGFISEKHFDYVIDHSYAVREHFFFFVLKIVTTVMFFTVSLAILLQSKVFDTTAQLTNIVEFMVISVTPTLVLKFFEKDTDTSMKDHETDIKRNTTNYQKTIPPTTTKSALTKWSKCFGFLCCCAKYDYTDEPTTQTPCPTEHNADPGKSSIQQTNDSQQSQSNSEEDHVEEIGNESTMNDDDTKCLVSDYA